MSWKDLVKQWFSRTKAGLNDLISCIQNLHALKSIDLIFEKSLFIFSVLYLNSSDTIADAEINNLIKELEKLPSLEQISLDFSR